MQRKNSLWHSTIPSARGASFLCFFGGICLQAETVIIKPPKSDNNMIALTCTISSDAGMTVDAETINVRAASPCVEIIALKKLGLASVLGGSDRNKRSFILQMTIKQNRHTIPVTPHVFISWFMQKPSNEKKPCARYIAW
jgi:hypothetical protein